MQEHPFALNGCCFVLCFYIHCSMSEASSACQSHHNQRQPVPCQHHSNHRCCNRRGEIARCVNLHRTQDRIQNIKIAPVRSEWVLVCSMFLYPLFNKRCKQCRSRSCQSHHNQRQPVPCQHHSNHRCCNRRGEISRCIKSSLHARAPVRSEWVLVCSMFLYPLFDE